MQCDQSKPSESRSVALGGAVGELPKACMKARALIPGTEVDPHRESQSLLFAKRPVESYRQKVAGDRSKPSLLSQRLKEEALSVPGESAREVTPQQRVRIADVFMPASADWSWRRAKKGSAAEPVTTILSVYRNSSTESAGDDPDLESEYVLAAGPQRSSQPKCPPEVCAKDSLRSSQTTDTQLTALLLKKERGALSPQGLALRTLTALHSWARSRPKPQCVSDVKDIGRLMQPRLQPCRENSEPGGSSASVVVTQRLQLPPAIPPIPIQKVAGFNTDNA